MKNPAYWLHHLRPAKRDISRYCVGSFLPYHIPMARIISFKYSFLIHPLENNQQDNYEKQRIIDL